MNVSIKEKSDNRAVFTVEIAADDYAQGVEKQLKAIKREGNFQGFRKGKVPVGLVKKMYGERVKLDEVFKQVAEGMEKAIRDNELKTLGQPIQTEDSPKQDFSKQDDFSFEFVVALRPEIKNLPSKEDKLPYKEVEVTDQMVDEHVEQILQNNPKFVEAESVQDNDMITGAIYELDENDKPKEGGLSKEKDATILVSMIKDEEEKKKFVGSSINSVIIFNPFKAFDGSTAEIASILGLKKEDVEGVEGNFSFEIEKISRTEKRELDQEFFDLAFGEGNVKSVEEFKEKIKENLQAQYKGDTDYQFYKNAKEYYQENNLKEVELDEETLKNWFKTTEAAEKIEEDEFDSVFAEMIKDLKYQLFFEACVKEHDIQVEEDEVKAYARSSARMQFAQYGINNLQDEILDNYVESMMQKPETVENMRQAVLENKFALWLKDNCDLQVEKVTPEEFYNVPAPEAQAEGEADEKAEEKADEKSEE